VVQVAGGGEGCDGDDGGAVAAGVVAVCRGGARMDGLTGGRADGAEGLTNRQAGGRIHKGRDHWRRKPKTLKGTF